MSALELRHSIVEQLLRIEDESFLSAIKTIIETRGPVGICTLNDYQKDRIKMAREELRFNQTIAHNDLQKEINKWLHVK